MLLYWPNRLKTQFFRMNRLFQGVAIALDRRLEVVTGQLIMKSELHQRSPSARDNTSIGQLGRNARELIDREASRQASARRRLEPPGVAQAEDFSPRPWQTRA